MARLTRITIPSYPHHIVQRGNNRQAVFFTDNDYCFFLECLRQAKFQCSCRIYAYVLMTNHCPTIDEALRRLFDDQQINIAVSSWRAIGMRAKQDHLLGGIFRDKFLQNPLDNRCDILKTCHSIDLQLLIMLTVHLLKMYSDPYFTTSLLHEKCLITISLISLCMDRSPGGEGVPGLRCGR